MIQKVDGQFALGMDCIVVEPSTNENWLRQSMVHATMINDASTRFWTLQLVPVGDTDIPGSVLYQCMYMYEHIHIDSYALHTFASSSNA